MVINTFAKSYTFGLTCCALAVIGSICSSDPLFKWTKYNGQDCIVFPHCTTVNWLFCGFDSMCKYTGAQNMIYINFKTICIQNIHHNVYNVQCVLCVLMTTMNLICTVHCAICVPITKNWPICWSDSMFKYKLYTTVHTTLCNIVHCAICVPITMNWPICWSDSANRHRRSARLSHGLRSNHCSVQHTTTLYDYAPLYFDAVYYRHCRDYAQTLDYTTDWCTSLCWTAKYSAASLEENNRGWGYS